MSQICGRGTNSQQGPALVFSIYHSWRHSFPNGNTLVVSILDDYQREVMEEFLQPLQMFCDVIKGSRCSQESCSPHIWFFCLDCPFTVASLSSMFPYFRRKKESSWISRSLTTHRPWQPLDDCSTCNWRLQ